MIEDDEAIERVYEVANTVRDSPICWIEAPDGCFEDNDGSDFCRECGIKVLEVLRTKDSVRSSQYFLEVVDGYESDSLRICCKCGTPLRVNLTDYGRDEELHHWRENGVGPDPTGHVAYDLGILIDATVYLGCDEKIRSEVAGFCRDYLKGIQP